MPIQIQFEIMEAFQGCKNYPNHYCLKKGVLKPAL